MTITSASLTQEGTSLSSSGDGTTAQRNYSAHYRVVTTSPTTSPKAIEDYFKSTQSLPWFGRSWKWSGSEGSDRDSDSICKKFEISHTPGSAGIFRVEATFEPREGNSEKEKPNNGDGTQTKDPLEWREQVTISYTQITIPVMHAIFRGFTTGEFANDPIRGTNRLKIGKTYPPMASNMVRFVPAPEMELDIKVVRFVRNVPTFNSNDYDPWIGTVNEDAVVINKPNLGFQLQFGPFAGRLKQVNASSDFQNGVSFFRRETELWINPQGWRGKLLDEGDCVVVVPEDPDYIAGVGGERPSWQTLQTTLRDKKNYPSATPKPLDGTGRLLKYEDENGNLIESKFVWSNWSYYPERAWQPIAQAF